MKVGNFFRPRKKFATIIAIRPHSLQQKNEIPDIPSSAWPLLSYGHDLPKLIEHLWVAESYKAESRDSKGFRVRVSHVQRD